jgi:hypothetical protein
MLNAYNFRNDSGNPPSRKRRSVVCQTDRVCLFLEGDPAESLPIFVLPGARYLDLALDAGHADAFNKGALR